MAYKYKSILKTFQYSKESYKIISDFLLSGDITDPNILLNVTKISKDFGKLPNEWFRISTTISFVKAVIQIKLEDNTNGINKNFKKFIKSNMSDTGITLITQKQDMTDTGNTRIGQNLHFIAILEDLDNKQLLRLMKEIGLVMVKKGGSNLSGEALQGTWIHKDLAIKYVEWLDPKFSIWISQKINELITDGVSWNEIRAITKMDYKPLILAIEKYVMPKYPNMDENILKGQIANYINMRVIGQKAKTIREEKGIELNELTRDYFEESELKQIEKVQIFTEMLITQLDIHDFKSLEEKISKYKF